MSHPANELIPQLARTVAQFLVWIDKTEAYAAQRGFDANVLLSQRLAPDMFPLVRQIDSACDAAKLVVTRLTGKPAPKHADNEATWGELRARVQDVLGWLADAEGETWATADEAWIRFPWLPGKKLAGRPYLLQFAVPNFYFHASMTYALLRHAGVPLGKADFLGGLPFIDDEG